MSANTYHIIPDLAAVAAEHLREASPDRNIQGSKVHADSHVKILILPFCAGQSLPDCQSPHAGTLQVLKGRGEVTLGGETRAVEEGALIVLPPNLTHGIKAETEMAVLLQVFLHQTSEQ
jgi:quercetin dioxygenase-like cupin family protein